jgi:polysaccharide export outer membrane protein
MVESSNMAIRGAKILFLASLVMLLSSCGSWNPWKSKHPYPPEATYELRAAFKYKIGPGDSVEIFVWRYPEVSTTVPVRPDGFITAPLLEDIPAAGKTPTELARDLEEQLSVYLRDPLVTVIVQGFVGVFPDQIRLMGEATSNAAIPYRDGMTLLDLMIQVGGISEFAAGNRAVLVRWEDGEQQKYTLRLDDLIRDADLSANTDMRPGDIIIVPQSWF